MENCGVQTLSKNRFFLSVRQGCQIDMRQACVRLSRLSDRHAVDTVGVDLLSCKEIGLVMQFPDSHAISGQRSFQLSGEGVRVNCFSGQRSLLNCPARGCG